VLHVELRPRHLAGRVAIGEVADVEHSQHGFESMATP
jgi:hypothetical protein